MEINGIESAVKSSYTAKRRMPPPFFLPKRGDRPTTIFFTPSLLGVFLYLLIESSQKPVKNLYAFSNNALSLNSKTV